MSADVMKAYGEEVTKLQEAGWPIQVQGFGRFGKFTKQRPKSAHAWAHQKDPRYGAKSMIEYKVSGFASPGKVKSTYLKEKASGWSPIVDEGKELQYVMTHETAHTMVQFKRGAGTGSLGVNGAKVIDQAEEIFDRYKAKLRSSKAAIDKEMGEWFDNYMQNSSNRERYYSFNWGDKHKFMDEVTAKINKKHRGDWFIADYATKNLEEFWAESFAMVTLSSNPSPFAQEIVALVKANIKAI